MWQLDSSKSHKIKDGQEFKHTDKWIKLVKEVDNDIPPQVESKGSTKADDADILSQVWDERVFRHLPHVQYLTHDIKSNALENIHNMV